MHIYNGAWWIGGAGAAGVSLYILHLGVWKTSYILVWVLGVSLGTSLLIHLSLHSYNLIKQFFSSSLADSKAGGLFFLEE